MPGPACSGSQCSAEELYVLGSESGLTPSEAKLFSVSVEKITFALAVSTYHMAGKS